MSDSVRVETKDDRRWTDWYKPFFERTPGGRLQGAQGQREQLGMTEAPTEERPPNLWGFPAAGQWFKERGYGLGRDVLNASDFIGSLFTGKRPAVGAGDIAFPRFVDPAEPDLLPSPIVPGNPMWDILREEERRKEAEMMGEPASRTLQDYLMGNQFDSTPYDNYMSFLLEQDAETQARIQAMYAQLADSAEENMQRIQDIYGSAQATSGDVFGQSAQSIEDAYASSSQQAADQMARLGVEAAAPAALNPMALSQAEALSGIERAGAASLDALGRYGTTAEGFGSQMAQVGQQQGLEVSNAIMRDMAQRQAEAAFMREQARADFNPYARAMQQMEAEQMFDSMGQPSIEMQKLMFQMEEAMAKGQLEYQRWKRNRIDELSTAQSPGARPEMTREEAEAHVNWLEQLVPGY